jgi:hypothetical protein
VEWDSRTPKYKWDDDSEKSFLFTLKNPHNIPARRFALKAVSRFVHGILPCCISIRVESVKRKLKLSINPQVRPAPPLNLASHQRYLEIFRAKIEKPTKINLQRERDIKSR